MDFSLWLLAASWDIEETGDIQVLRRLALLYMLSNAGLVLRSFYTYENCEGMCLPPEWIFDWIVGYSQLGCSVEEIDRHLLRLFDVHGMITEKDDRMELIQDVLNNYEEMDVKNEKMDPESGKLVEVLDDPDLLSKKEEITTSLYRRFLHLEKTTRGNPI